MMNTSQNRSLSDAFQIVTQIRRIVRAINLHSQHLSKSVGLTVPQLVLLQTLSVHPGERAATSLLRTQIGVSPATMSGLVDRLVKRGLLSRERLQTDRRVVELSLTPAGSRMLLQAPAPLQEQVLERLQQLPTEERHAILASLEHIVKLMGADDLDASPLLTPGSKVSQ